MRLALLSLDCRGELLKGLQVPLGRGHGLITWSAL